MSLFKVKEWWSNTKLQHEGGGNGLQNGSCMKVDKFNLHSDSDCIIVGEGSELKLFKPGIEQSDSDTLLELQLDAMVLQIETGKFTVDAVDRQILILHSQSYSVYCLHKNGDQNFASQIIKHSFTRKAYNLAVGPFGKSKARDLICIQALDGTFSFFDQDTFMFMCLFNDIIIPGPICYVASSDLFVICKSTWVMEIYSYQQLEEFSELNARQNKKNIPQWTYNVGEEVLSVQVLRTSPNFSSVIALGERHLYCFQDNGLMKFMIRFDYMPICFHAYLIGWYYEPASRLLLMVASDDSKLFIYEGTSLLWSCSLLDTVIAVSRCYVTSLPGGLVTLSTKGIINVCYLGTEPDLNANLNAAPIVDQMEPRQVQEELEAVEKSLQKVLDYDEDDDGDIEKIIKIKIDVGKPVQNLHTTSMNDKHQALHLLMCPVVIMLTCEDPKLIQNIQITSDCCPPFECSEPIVCLDTINGTEIIETQVFLSSEADISETWMKILFTITDNEGRISILPHKVLLPLSLYCSPVTLNAEGDIRLVLLASHPCVDLKEMFIDFYKELSTHPGALNTVTFVYRTTNNNHVSIKSEGSRYTIEARDYADVYPLLDNFITKLKEYHTQTNTKNFVIKFQLSADSLKQILHKFLKSVETHAKERMSLKVLENELNVLQRQFTVIQKRLLVQYGALPPGDCDPLEFLMRDTHERLINSAGQVIESRENVCRASCTLSAVGSLVITILKHTITDTFMLKLVEEMLSFPILYEHTQEWEEAVIQAASYILNNVIKRSEKDKEKLATVTDQDVLSQVNLKKLLKQLRIILDHTFTRADDTEETKEKIKRIEELVEVI